MRYIWETPVQLEMLSSHVAAVSEEFSSDLKCDQNERHPLSDSASGVDPERLAEAIDAILQDSTSPSAADQLSLLAARIEWISEEATREHLREKISEARNAIDQNQS